MAGILLWSHLSLFQLCLFPPPIACRTLKTWSQFVLWSWIPWSVCFLLLDHELHGQFVPWSWILWSVVSICSLIMNSIVSLFSVTRSWFPWSMIGRRSQIYDVHPFRCLPFSFHWLLEELRGLKWRGLSCENKQTFISYQRYKRYNDRRRSWYPYGHEHSRVSLYFT